MAALKVAKSKNWHLLFECDSLCNVYLSIDGNVGKNPGCMYRFGQNLPKKGHFGCPAVGEALTLGKNP